MTRWIKDTQDWGKTRVPQREIRGEDFKWLPVALTVRLMIAGPYRLDGYLLSQ